MQTQTTRARTVLLGVVLAVEVFFLPVAWWITVGIGLLFSEASWPSWMVRLGNWGMLPVAISLAGSAMGLLLRPPRYRQMVTVLLYTSASLNAVVALAVVWLNATSEASLGSHVAGIVFFAVPFGLVAAGLLYEATRGSWWRDIGHVPLPPGPVV